MPAGNLTSSSCSTPPGRCTGLRSVPRRSSTLGSADFVCPDGDCYTPLNGDDQASKLYQSKEALYQVLKGVKDVDFGFATFNQDNLYMRAKHWLYAAAEGGPTISGFGPYPPVGAQEVFGLQWSCVSNNGSNTDRQIGCNSSNPADLGNAWELARVQRLPKGDVDFGSTQTFYVRSSGTKPTGCATLAIPARWATRRSRSGSGSSAVTAMRVATLDLGRRRARHLQPDQRFRRLGLHRSVGRRRSSAISTRARRRIRPRSTPARAGIPTPIPGQMSTTTTAFGGRLPWILTPRSGPFSTGETCCP